MNVEQIMHQLKNPFPPEDIEWRVGSTTAEWSEITGIKRQTLQYRLKKGLSGEALFKEVV